MQITDAIADMLTRIRNAGSAGHATVDIPQSNLKKSIAQILLDEGYIEKFELLEGNTQGVIRVTLKYSGRKHVISGIKRISNRYRDHLYIQGRYDRQGSQKARCRRRSPCLHLVIVR